jgi:hydrogenase maturation protease
MPAAAVVIGVGNEWRRDDGAGWAVARAVGAGLGGAVEVVLTDGEPARLLDAWAGVALAVVVDAVRTGAEPGSVHVLELGDVMAGVAPARSPGASHALGLDTAVRLGAALGRLPQRLVVVGVEGADFGDGQGLSPTVAGAVESAAAEVRAAVTRSGPLTRFA